MLAGLSGGLCYALAKYDIKRIDGRIIISRHGQQANLKADGSAAEASAASCYSGTDAIEDASLPPRDPSRKILRIASFNLDGFNSRKLAMPLIAERLTAIIAGFDVIAVQDVRESHVGSLHELLEVVNARGRHFDFAVAPEVGRGSVTRYNAFIFNRATVEIDRFKICEVTDTAGLMRCRPLVGVFRARGPQTCDAFTFVLVNVNVDYDRVSAGLDILDDVYRAVRAANPREDDILLLGNFEVDLNQAAPPAFSPGATWALDGIVSTVRGDRLADNLAFDRLATAEFTGRADVIDVVRGLNVTTEEALRISSHLPVWAEFSAYEGGPAGHFANKKAETQLK